MNQTKACEYRNLSKGLGSLDRLYTKARRDKGKHCMKLCWGPLKGLNLHLEQVFLYRMWAGWEALFLQIL